MKKYSVPVNWSAEKFTTRYSLNRDKDFYIDADRQLIIFPTLPDDPPIFEVSDPQPLPLSVRIAAMSPTVFDSSLKAILIELCQHVGF